jgi:phosphopantothenoylcysteine synthetase/decarboxylase
MWQHPAVQRNAEVLRARGLQFLGPVDGHLAEGYDAVGRMAEPEQIAGEILRLGGAADR